MEDTHNTVIMDSIWRQSVVLPEKEDGCIDYPAPAPGYAGPVDGVPPLLRSSLVGISAQATTEACGEGAARAIAAFKKGPAAALAEQQLAETG